MERSKDSVSSRRGSDGFIRWEGKMPATDDDSLCVSSAAWHEWSFVVLTMILVRKQLWLKQTKQNKKNRKRERGKYAGAVSQNLSCKVTTTSSGLSFADQVLSWAISLPFRCFYHHPNWTLNYFQHKISDIQLFCFTCDKFPLQGHFTVIRGSLESFFNILCCVPNKS